MNSLEMLREFKVGMDKIDSSSYPEIYDEQIFMYINKAIDEIVNEGRKVFEENQTITDNLKSLIPQKPLKILPSTTVIDNEYTFDLSNKSYLFYIRGHLHTQLIGTDFVGKASAIVTQHDDIEVILDDPYNKPKPYKVPITFSRNTITAYGASNFKIVDLYLVFVKKPAIVSATTSCDLDEQLHYMIVNRAIVLAEISLGLLNNKQE